MNVKGWAARLGEVGTAPVQATWAQVWPLMARAQVDHDLRSLKAWLWRHRVAAWALSLDSDGSCRACGGLKPIPSREGRLFCSDTCRVSMHQHVDKGDPVPLQRLLTWADAEHHALHLQAAEAAAWLEASHQPWILPPDLAALDNLPPLPDRCGGGCAHPCRWTGGGPCLYAGTAQET